MQAGLESAAFSAGSADTLPSIFHSPVAFPPMVYSGIDYGFGLANVDPDNGIRYGVINASSLPAWFWDTVQSEGADLDYEDAVSAVKDEIKSALRSALSDYAATADCDDLAQTVLDSIEIDCESTGDCTRYRYNKDGLIFETTSDGSIFVIKSPYYALCSYCSPCAPGAGWLESEGSVKAYCLPTDWFNDSSANTAPYVAHKVPPCHPCQDGTGDV